MTAGVPVDEAVSHGEQGLASVPPTEVEPLLERLAKLTDSSARVIEIYERQVTRCKVPSDKLAALGRATTVAARLGAFDKARAFFDLALGSGVQEETLNTLEAIARASDAEQKTAAGKYREIPRFLGRLELRQQIRDGRAQVIAALRCSLGKRGVGEMRHVLDAGPVLFDLDLAVEIDRHLLELADHVFEIGDLACFFIGFKAFRPERGFTRFHVRYP